jgi:hypothetical protein
VHCSAVQCSAVQCNTLWIGWPGGDTSIFLFTPACGGTTGVTGLGMLVSVRVILIMMLMLMLMLMMLMLMQHLTGAAMGGRMRLGVMETTPVLPGGATWARVIMLHLYLYLYL